MIYYIDFEKLQNPHLAHSKEAEVWDEAVRDIKYQAVQIIIDGAFLGYVKATQGFKELADLLFSDYLRAEIKKAIKAKTVVGLSELEDVFRKKMSKEAKR